MSVYINFRKADETKLRDAIGESHEALRAYELPDVFEVDYVADDSGSSVNAVSDSFRPDTDALFKALQSARIPVYGGLDDWESGHVLFVVSDDKVSTVEAIGGDGYPAVRVNPDGSIDPERVAAAVEYWALYHDAHEAIHGVDLEVAKASAPAMAQETANQLVRGSTDRADSSALDEIARVLDANEWNAETMSHIADVVRETGRTIRDTEDSKGRS